MVTKWSKRWENVTVSAKSGKNTIKIKYHFKIVFQASLKLNDALKHPEKKLSTKSLCHPRSCDVPGKGSVDPGYPQIYLENSWSTWEARHLLEFAELYGAGSRRSINWLVEWRGEFALYFSRIFQYFDTRLIILGKTRRLDVLYHLYRLQSNKIFNYSCRESDCVGNTSSSLRSRCVIQKLYSNVEMISTRKDEELMRAEEPIYKMEMCLVFSCLG